MDRNFLDFSREDLERMLKGDVIDRFLEMQRALRDENQKLRDENQKLRERLKTATKFTKPENLIKRIWEEKKVDGTETICNFIRFTRGLPLFSGKNLYEMVEFPILALFYKNLVLSVGGVPDPVVLTELENRLFPEKIPQESPTRLSVTVDREEVTLTRGLVGKLPEQGDFQISVKNDETGKIVVNVYEVKIRSHHWRGCPCKKCIKNRSIDFVESRQDTGNMKSINFYETWQNLMNSDKKLTWKDENGREFSVKYQFWFVSNEGNLEAFYETKCGVKYISTEFLAMKTTDGSIIRLKDGKRNEVKPEKVNKRISIKPENYETKVERFSEELLNLIYRIDDSSDSESMDYVEPATTE